MTKKILILEIASELMLIFPDVSVERAKQAAKKILTNRIERYGLLNEDKLEE